MNIILIPCAPTEWRSRGRLLGRAPVAMSDAGRARCTEWAAGIAALGPPRIFHSSDELATETAKLLAKALGASTRKMRELDEIDLGLWAGLTEVQLRARFKSAYHQLTESPLSVVPPEGEPIADAVERIGRALDKRITQNSLPAAAFVLRPMAMAAARCHLENKPLSELWSESHYDGGPLTLDNEAPNQQESRATVRPIAPAQSTREMEPVPDVRRDSRSATRASTPAATSAQTEKTVAPPAGSTSTDSKPVRKPRRSTAGEPPAPGSSSPDPERNPS